MGNQLYNATHNKTTRKSNFLRETTTTLSSFTLLLNELLLNLPN